MQASQKDAMPVMRSSVSHQAKTYATLAMKKLEQKQKSHKPGDASKKFTLPVIQQRNKNHMRTETNSDYSDIRNANRRPMSLKTQTVSEKSTFLSVNSASTGATQTVFKRIVVTPRDTTTTANLPMQRKNLIVGKEVASPASFRDSVIRHSNKSTRSCSAASSRASDSIKNVDKTIDRFEMMKLEWAKAHEDFDNACDESIKAIEAERKVEGFTD